MLIAIIISAVVIVCEAKAMSSNCINIQAHAHFSDTLLLGKAIKICSFSENKFTHRTAFLHFPKLIYRYYFYIEELEKKVLLWSESLRCICLSPFSLRNWCDISWGWRIYDGISNIKRLGWHIARIMESNFKYPFGGVILGGVRSKAWCGKIDIGTVSQSGSFVGFFSDVQLKISEKANNRHYYNDQPVRKRWFPQARNPFIFWVGFFIAFIGWVSFWIIGYSAFQLGDYREAAIIFSISIFLIVSGVYLFHTNYNF